MMIATRTAYERDHNNLGATLFRPSNWTQGHTALPGSNEVQQKVLEFLNKADGGVMPASDATSRAAVAATTPAEELYYVSLNNVTDVVVTDDQGNSTAITADGYRGEVPYVTQYDINDIQTDVLLPISGNYSITFRSNSTVPQISIRQGTGDTTTRSIRYLNAVTPSNAAGKLVFSNQGPAPINYDQDGNGSYQTIVTPDVDLSGPAAADQRGPTIQFTTGAQGSGVVVTILASDSESGVKTTRYSIDGRMYQVYSGPFTVNPAQVTKVSAFADDNAGNRSGIYEVAISGGNTPNLQNQATKSTS